MFNTGPVYMTQGAQAVVPPDDGRILAMIGRHRAGDFGCICEEDKEVNNDAIKHHSGMVLSEYSEEGERLWVITNFAGNETYTTILLPSEY